MGIFLFGFATDMQKSKSFVARVCMCAYGGGRGGEQTWLTVWISSRCKSASVTDGRPLIAGLWRLGSHRKRKSLSVSLRGMGRRRLGTPGQPRVLVSCLHRRADLSIYLRAKTGLERGLSYFDSSAVSSASPWEVVSETIISFLLIVLLLMAIFGNWTEKAECINKCKCDERKHKSDCIITVSDIRSTACFAKRGALSGACFW